MLWQRWRYTTTASNAGIDESLCSGTWTPETWQHRLPNGTTLTHELSPSR
jgi:hypothetical protein